MKRQGLQQPIINHIDVKSVDEYSSKVQQLGGKVHVPKTAVPGMGYFAICLDTENMMDWTNIAKTMSANQDEEIWVEQVYYRDSKQRDEYMAMCGKDENMERLYKQFMDLITPGSTIMGEFTRLEV